METIKKWIKHSLHTLNFLLDCTQKSCSEFEKQKIEEYEDSCVPVSYEAWQKGIHLDDTE